MVPKKIYFIKQIYIFVQNDILVEGAENIIVHEPEHTVKRYYLINMQLKRNFGEFKCFFKYELGIT